MEAIIDLALAITLIFLLRHKKFSKVNSYIKLALMLLVVGIVHLFNPAFSSYIEIGAVITFILLERFFPRSNYEGHTHDENILNVSYLAMKHAVAITFLPIVVYYFGAVEWGMSAANLPIWLQGIIVLLVIDFKQYWIHRGQHKFDFWWSCHQVHHSSTKLNIFAADRTNLVEWFLLQEATTVLILTLMGASVESYLYYYIPGSLMSRYVAHANIDLKWKKVPLWAYVFGSPPVHAFHHTKQKEIVNYGEVFVIWDVIFGTFKSPLTKWNDFGAQDISVNNVIKQQLHPVLKLIGKV